MVLFLSVSLCLSRACLVKMFVFIYKRLKKTVFTHRALEDANHVAAAGGQEEEQPGHTPEGRPARAANPARPRDLCPSDLDVERAVERSAARGDAAPSASCSGLSST